MFTFYVCIYVINFSNLLVGCIFWPALGVLHHCVFQPAFGWLVIHWYILSRYSNNFLPNIKKNVSRFLHSGLGLIASSEKWTIICPKMEWNRNAENLFEILKFGATYQTFYWFQCNCKTKYIISSVY